MAGDWTASSRSGRRCSSTTIGMAITCSRSLRDVSILLKKEVLMEALYSIGILEGDLLFIHSDLRVSGIPAEARTREAILKFYYDSLREAVGEEGTVAVPAYFYEYA